MLNVSPSGTFKRADWASVADASTRERRRWSRQRAVGRRLRMGSCEYREAGNIKESSLSRVAACTQQAAARRSARRRCVCETMAHVRQGRPCLSFLAVHPQPYATFATLRIASAQATSVPCSLLISFPSPTTPWQPSCSSSVYYSRRHFSINMMKVDEKRKQRVCDKILMSYVSAAAEQI